MQRINRPEFLDFLIRSKERQIIKVVSGIRRCGKSTLFDIYRDWLSQNGVAEERIISVNFEDIGFERLNNYRPLYDYVQSLLLPDKMNYVFLDEIQHVEQFEFHPRRRNSSWMKFSMWSSLKKRLTACSSRKM